jgi:hypothetical protein
MFMWMLQGAWDKTACFESVYVNVTHSVRYNAAVRFDVYVNVTHLVWDKTDYTSCLR